MQTQYIVSGFWVSVLFCFSCYFFMMVKSFSKLGCSWGQMLPSGCLLHTPINLYHVTNGVCTDSVTLQRRTGGGPTPQGCLRRSRGRLFPHWANKDCLETSPVGLLPCLNPTPPLQTHVYVYFSVELRAIHSNCPLAENPCATVVGGR